MSPNENTISNAEAGRMAWRLTTAAIHAKAYLEGWLKVSQGIETATPQPLQADSRVKIQSLLRGIRAGVENSNRGCSTLGEQRAAYLLGLELLPKQAVHQPPEQAIPAIRTVIERYLAVLWWLNHRPEEGETLSVQDLEDLRAFFDGLEKRGHAWHRSQQQG